MPRQLAITPTPYRSSFLAIPPTPFSPRLPITPPASPPKQHRLTDRTKRLQPANTYPPPPSPPLHWLWQCHKCNRVYQLGITRRCLDDGHLFCAGTTVMKRSKRNGYKKTLRHQACASEFDYQGWKAWGTWRRSLMDQVDAAEALDLADKEADSLFSPTAQSGGQWLNGRWVRRPADLQTSRAIRKKDCSNHCDYPSECRWGKQYGVQTPVRATAVVPSSPPPAPQKPSKVAETMPPVTFDDILLDVSEIVDPASPDYLEPLTAAQSQSQKGNTEGETRIVSMDDLLDSVKRRKRRSSGLLPSPLGANPPDAELAPVRDASTQSLQKAFDDFELDLFKGFGGATDKAENFVKGLFTPKKKVDSETREPGSL
ncbi:hypothetical protein TI39_contig4143g00011 [Zymoseptoria brevis]|uniref:Uncharacterized protein n=1 Tax=Zymoseptoria brevis TaxID=1047168 RepID=A0A0F4GFS2_9PEZI|nr:hypothetical protein TI39_contig4143g00011 [Zymoseptoria brevis]